MLRPPSHPPFTSLFTIQLGAQLNDNYRLPKAILAPRYLLHDAFEIDAPPSYLAAAGRDTEYGVHIPSEIETQAQYSVRSFGLLQEIVTCLSRTSGMLLLPGGMRLAGMEEDDFQQSQWRCQCVFIISVYLMFPILYLTE